ncbi:MAG: hypothetical protein PUB86_02465 [Elusimicrobia bacterium]|nr:hypothetical protein [Elusimicrobiota bacterium]
MSIFNFFRRDDLRQKIIALEKKIEKYNSGLPFDFINAVYFLRYNGLSNLHCGRHELIAEAKLDIASSSKKEIVNIVAGKIKKYREIFNAMKKIEDLYSYLSRQADQGLISESAAEADVLEEILKFTNCDSKEEIYSRLLKEGFFVTSFTDNKGKKAYGGIAWDIMDGYFWKSASAYGYKGEVPLLITVNDAVRIFYNGPRDFPYREDLIIDWGNY